MSPVELDKAIDDVIRSFGAALLPVPFVSRESLAAWKKQESADRLQIDAIVRDWLTHGPRSRDVPESRAKAALMRFALASSWLQHTKIVSLQFQTDLDRLLIDCWPDLLQDWLDWQELVTDSYLFGYSNGYDKALVSFSNPN